MKDRKLARIQRLVGAVREEDLRYVECFVGDEVALFMPAGGACRYAITPEHGHPAYMFIFSFDDRTKVQIDGNVLTCERGRIFCLSPEIPHQELPSDSPPHYIAVMIGKRFFESQFAYYETGVPAELRGVSCPAPRNLLPTLQRFMIEAEHALPGSVPVLAALGVDVCHSIIRATVRMPVVGNRVTERVEVNRVVEHIHVHLGKKISIDTMSGVARMSPSHFTRVFAGETGKTPAEYVRSVRLQTARRMLIAGDLSITEIALECGFGSVSYFSSCFRRWVGIAPSEYQKRVQKKSKSVNK